MNLIWFLTIATIFSIALGEFGKFPFGLNITAISLTDLLLLANLIFLSIWKITIKKDLSIPPRFILIILFWIAGILSLVISGDFSGAFYLFRFILYSSAFLIGFFIIKDGPVNLESIFKLMVLTGLIIAVLGFLQLILVPDFEFLTAFGFDPHKYRLASTFLDPNFTGAFLNITFLTALYLWAKYKEKKFLLAIFLILTAVILTFSRSAYLMFLVQILFFGFFRLKKLLFLTIIFFGLLYAFYMPFNQRVSGALVLDKSASERLDSWNTGFEIVQSHPFFGIGFNNLRSYKFENNLNKIFSDNNNHSGAGLDSSFLVILATSGIIGFIIYLAWWVKIFEEFAKLIKNPFKNELFLLVFSLAAGLFVDSQFINSLLFSPILLVIYIIFGAVFSTLKK